MNADGRQPATLSSRDAIVARLAALTVSGERRMLGVTGPPGAGKSTLALTLAALVPHRSAIVPMDGFHLANVELARLGRADRKGAPDTFDAAGYVALLGRLRAQQRHEMIYAPEFRREIEESIAGAIPIDARAALIVTEGNYLLLDQPPWNAVRTLLDEIWYVELDAPERVRRLIARHELFGRSSAAARDWVFRSDEPNAALVAATRERADYIVAVPPEPLDARTG